MFNQKIKNIIAVLLCGLMIPVLVAEIPDVVQVPVIAEEDGGCDGGCPLPPDEGDGSGGDGLVSHGDDDDGHDGGDDGDCDDHGLISHGDDDDDDCGDDDGGCDDH